MFRNIFLMVGALSLGATYVAPQALAKKKKRDQVDRLNKAPGLIPGDYCGEIDGGHDDGDEVVMSIKKLPTSKGSFSVLMFKPNRKNAQAMLYVANPESESAMDTGEESHSVRFLLFPYVVSDRGTVGVHNTEASYILQKMNDGLRIDNNDVPNRAGFTFPAADFDSDSNWKWVDSFERGEYNAYKKSGAFAEEVEIQSEVRAREATAYIKGGPNRGSVILRQILPPDGYVIRKKIQSGEYGAHEGLMPQAKGFMVQLYGSFGGLPIFQDADDPVLLVFGAVSENSTGPAQGSLLEK